MTKRIFLNALGLIVIIFMVIIQIGAKFLQMKYGLTYLSPWIPVVINSCIILLGGLLLLFNFIDKKMYKCIFSAFILLSLVAFIGFSSQAKEIKENRNIYSVSPDKKNIFYLKEDGQTVTYYQSYYLVFGKMREVFPYSVEKIGKPQWVTNDVAAVTYQDTTGHLHIYLGTYGYRGSALSYKYVTSLTRGIWENELSNVNLSNIRGNIQVSDKGSISTYASDQIVQFGTSGVVLTDKSSAKYAYVIPENALYEPDDTPNNLQDIQLLAFKPNLENIEVVKLKYTGGEQ
ncbi:hypothetical protein NH621_09500 [Lactococcus formosensis]|uniref:hypothetical protein n=1 Tax=Lactococcus formosensis TaxID=1281486 RepID=UPI002097375A|nr:hypothetical protein [Lactococcus formosensis]MCO7181405.1 hypothetical protein [Lactococcus formosensis]